MPFYHVWFTTRDNRRRFVGEARPAARRAMEQAAQAGGFEVNGVEVAADHAHLVVHLKAGQELEAAVRTVQAAAAQHAGGAAEEVWAAEYGHRQVPLSDLARVLRLIYAAGEAEH